MKVVLNITLTVTHTIVHIHAYIFVYFYSYTIVHIHAYICIYNILTCMYTHTHTHTLIMSLYIINNLRKPFCLTLNRNSFHGDIIVLPSFLSLSLWSSGVFAQQVFWESGKQRKCRKTHHRQDGSAGKAGIGMTSSNETKTSLLQLQGLSLIYKMGVKKSSPRAEFSLPNGCKQVFSKVQGLNLVYKKYTKWM